MVLKPPRCRSLARRRAVVARWRATFVERTAVTGQHAGVVGQVLDHGLGVRPVHLRRLLDEPPECPRSVTAGPRSPGIVGEVLMSTRDVTRSGTSRARSWRERPAGRIAAHVCRLYAVGSRAPRRRRPPGRHPSSQVGPVRRSPIGRCRGGCSGSRTAPSVGEHPAEPVLPPEHRTVPSPMTRRTSRASVGSPKGSVQSSTPLTWTMRSTTKSPLGATKLPCRRRRKPGTHRCRVSGRPSGRPMPTTARRVSVGHG